jgi:Family of unknown function (DUF6153)
VVGVPITLTNTPRLCRWVAVVTLALGLVAMHHLVGTHTHPSSSQDSSPGMTMLAPAIENYGSTSAEAAVIPAQPDTDVRPMLHLCQAVLTGLVLLAGLSLAWWLAPRSEPRSPGGGLSESANRQRAPPTPLRLASLGVLRL